VVISVVANDRCGQVFETDINLDSSASHICHHAGALRDSNAARSVGVNLSGVVLDFEGWTCSELADSLVHQNSLVVHYVPLFDEAVLVDGVLHVVHNILLAPKLLFDHAFRHVAETRLRPAVFLELESHLQREECPGGCQGLLLPSVSDVCAGPETKTASFATSFARSEASRSVWSQSLY
jgi:hypothetical protein